MASHIERPQKYPILLIALSTLMGCTAAIPSPSNGVHRLEAEWVSVQEDHRLGFALAAGEFDGASMLAVGTRCESDGDCRASAFTLTDSTEPGELDPDESASFYESAPEFGFASDLAIVGEWLVSRGEGGIHLLEGMPEGPTRIGEARIPVEHAGVGRTNIACPDLDGDGAPELCAGGTRTVVYSGDMPLFTLEAGGRFGESLAVGELQNTPTLFISDAAAADFRGAIYAVTLDGSWSLDESDAYLMGDVAGDQLGFGLSTGDLDSDGNPDLVAPARLAHGGRGEVRLVTGDGSEHILTGRDSGSSFGFSTQVVDLDEDGVSELVVGAPDTNRVFIFPDPLGADPWSTVVELAPAESGAGRFGATLASSSGVGAELFIGADVSSIGAPRSGAVYRYRPHGR